MTEVATTGCGSVQIPSWVCETAEPDHDQILTQAYETPVSEAMSETGANQSPKDLLGNSHHGG